MTVLTVLLCGSQMIRFGSAKHPCPQDAAHLFAFILYFFFWGLLPSFAPTLPRLWKAQARATALKCMCARSESNFGFPSEASFPPSALPHTHSRLALWISISRLGSEEVLTDCFCLSSSVVCRMLMVSLRPGTKTSRRLNVGLHFTLAGESGKWMHSRCSWTR